MSKTRKFSRTTLSHMIIYYLFCHVFGYKNFLVTFLFGGKNMTFIKIKHLTFQYDTSYDLLFDDVSFILDSDWKLGLIGRNGRGKTTLLKILDGQLAYQRIIDTKISFEYFPYTIQDENQLTINIIENILGEVELWRLQKELSLLNVADCLYQFFSTLSGGQKTKILIATLFMKDNSFLLDEPTNHLDQCGRQQLCCYLRHKHGFIIVSHDRLFLDKCINHMISINKTNIEIKSGNFTSCYQNKINQDSLEMNRHQKLKKEIRQLESSTRQKQNWSYQIEKSKKGTFDKEFVGHRAAKMMKRAKSIEHRKEKMIEERKSLLNNVEDIEKLTLNPLLMNKSLVSFHHVSIYYDEKSIIDDLSFTIYPHDRICLQGENG